MYIRLLDGCVERKVQHHSLSHERRYIVLNVLVITSAVVPRQSAGLVQRSVHNQRTHDHHVSSCPPPIVGRCCPRSCAHSDSVDHRVSSCPRESADGVQGSVHTQGTYDQHVSRCARESVDVFQGFVNTPRTYDHHVRSCLPITCRWFPKGLCTLRERTISTSIVVSRESADGFPRFCAHSENGKSSRHQLSPESRPMFAQVLCTLRGWIITTSTIVSERRPTTLH